MERGGVTLEPLRGHKAWGLLAFLVRSQVPPSRERVASLLFPEADDPLGTLRWTLSALRRHLRDDAQLGGDPLHLKLVPETLVDVITSDPPAFCRKPFAVATPDSRLPFSLPASRAPSCAAASATSRAW